MSTSSERYKDMSRTKYAPYALLVLSLFAALTSHRCCAEQQNDVEVLPVKADSGYTFYIQNRTAEILQVMVTVELDNMASDVSFPYVATVSAHSKINAFSLHAANRFKSSGYRVEYKRRKTRFHSKTCIKNVFCIITQLEDDVLHFYVDNQQQLPVAVLFKPTVFRNLQSNTPLPLVKNCAGGRRTNLFDAGLVDKWADWDHTFAYQWHFGIVGAKPDSKYAYALPYKSGESHVMIQGFNGSFSHNGKYALDFEMPEGTSVCAARAGVVISVEEKYNVGGKLEALKFKANHIEVLHSDGTIARYAHLRKKGAHVRVGQHVQRGQVIGYSGNTGYSSGPHLHFEVVLLKDDLDFEGIPVKFRTSQDRFVYLREGDSYRAP